MWGTAARQPGAMYPSDWKEAQNQNSAGQNASSAETPRQVALSCKQLHKLRLHVKSSIFKLIAFILGRTKVVIFMFESSSTAGRV